MNKISRPTKKLVLNTLICSALAAQVACAEDQSTTSANPPPKSPQASGTEQFTWQKFDLDFPGGSPRDLVSAVEKASGKPVNALIPKDDETVGIPAMKFKAITIPDLFHALTMASQRREQVGGTVQNSFYTFDTQGQGENAIFYFKSQKASPPQKFCRFYQLAEVLQNYSIEDLTTAVQTGWKMLGVKSTPQLKFHPETKLLIAVGQPEELRVIDDVLVGLRSAPAPVSAQVSPGQKKDATPGKQ